MNRMFSYFWEPDRSRKNLPMQETFPTDHRMMTRFSWIIFGLILLLLLPALLINLEVNPLIEDECIRATVALEMNLTGDYLTPTIGNEAYLKKPPLYNWMLAGIFNLSGSQSEFIIRLPVVVAILLFSLIIFFFVKAETNRRLALATAVGFATCGRILFYESQHGLIDVTYSMFVFLNFMFVYRMGRQKKYLALFLGSYALTAFGFLFKGLPSLVFQAFTLFAWFAYSKDLKRLFSWQHVLGILLFAVPVLAYYLAYFLHNRDVTVEQMLGIMLGESTRRTGIRFGAFRTIAHLFTFPVEVTYHFLPWTVFFILLFRKGNTGKVMQNDFFRYSIWVVVLNIIPYWSSPEVFARYYIMLMPLVFLVFFYLYLDKGAERSLIMKILDILILIMAVAVSAIPVAYLVMERFTVIPHQVLKVAVLLLAAYALVAFLVFRKDRLERLLLIVLLLLVARMGVNWFIMPVKALESDRLVFRQEAIRAARISGDTPVIRYWPPELKATGYYGHRTASYLTIFYMTREKQQVLPYSTERPGDSALYLVRYMDLARLGIPYDRLCTVKYDKNYPPINLVKFRPGPPQ
jgi:4-amino-4-deoxy-L-arabinose transferase-like glycosyltransferase